MQGAWVAVVQSFVGGLDGVDVSDQIGHAHVWRGQLLDIPLASVHPSHRGFISLLFHQFRPLKGDGSHGVFWQWGAIKNRYPFIEQLGQAPGHARFGLAPKAQQIHAVSGQKGPLHIGNDGVFVPHDSLKQGSA